MHGLTWTRIAATVLAGSTTITLQEAVQWQPGSQIVLVTTTWKGGITIVLVLSVWHVLLLRQRLRLPAVGVA
jgi:hypothetical protein